MVVKVEPVLASSARLAGSYANFPPKARRTCETEPV
jgi:hypothetical protein